jgi:hypothetical protein
MTRIAIDWSQVSTADSFYDLVFAQTGAPGWHGRNLAALSDSWVTGAICESGPPFDFVFLKVEQAVPGLRELIEVIHGIARDSVAENGGSINV